MTLCVIILFRALPLLTIACRCNLSQNSHFEKLSIFRKPLPFPSIVPGSTSSPSSFPISPKLTQARAQLQRCNTLCLAKLMQAIQDAMIGSEVKQAVSRHSHLIVKSVRVSTTEPTAQSADDVVEPPVGRQPSPPSYSRPSSVLLPTKWPPATLTASDHPCRLEIYSAALPTFGPTAKDCPLYPVRPLCRCRVRKVEMVLSLHM